MHQPPGADAPVPRTTNVTLDLATPFFQGIYEMQHLPIPASLRGNIEYAYYPSGHMVYAHKDSLRDLHSKVAEFIRRTSAGH